MPTGNKLADPGFTLNTPDGRRRYIVHLFKTALRCRDYRQYINERLTDDFERTPAQHFEDNKARTPLLQQRLKAADHRIDELERSLREIVHNQNHGHLQHTHEAIVAAEELIKPTEAGRDQGILGTPFQRLKMQLNEGE